MFCLPESCQQRSIDVLAAKSGHPMEGCTLGWVFILLEQEMQEFGALGILSYYFLWLEHAQ